jgi:hypothetical protein
MRTISVLAFMSVVLVSSTALAQQPAPGKAGDKIGSPPPLPGPPPLSEPSLVTPSPTTPQADTAPKGDAPNTKGYLGAYAPAGTPPTPYSTAPLPSGSGGPGLNVVAPDGSSTKTVRAVPCSSFARETDGFTTCVGVPDQAPKRKR